VDEKAKPRRGAVNWFRVVAIASVFTAFSLLWLRHYGTREISYTDVFVAWLRTQVTGEYHAPVKLYPR
jgi:hypothetical protein